MHARFGYAEHNAINIYRCFLCKTEAWKQMKQGNIREYKHRLLAGKTCSLQ